MFPWVHEFRWEIGHLIFTGGFAAVFVIVVTSTIIVFKKVYQIYKEKVVDKIVWEATFEELPAISRTCRHALSGVFKDRICNNHFDCRECTVHKYLIEHRIPEKILAKAGSDGDTEIFGLDIPLDRMYHRGHTWVKQDDEGNYLVGIDDFANRLIGRAEEIILPEIGTQLHANGTAWTVKRGKADTRILSPIDGEVIETGNDEKGWYLKIKPAEQSDTTGHLLKGSKEIKTWFMKELERLQFALATDTVGVSLADGGVLIDDLPKSYPDADWDGVYGELFLEP
jgi:hypothetical protein